MTSPRNLYLLRALAIIVPTAGIAIDLLVLGLIGYQPKGTVPYAIYDIATLIGGVLVLCMTLLIAWRAGDHPPNVSMALALGFVFLTDSLLLLFQALSRADTILWHVLGNFTSFVGASLYIRATQLFPRRLTAEDLARSPTVWGKIRPLRALFTFLLRAPVVWLLMAILTALTIAVPNRELEEAVRIVIILVGLVYFYISFRAGDAESRRKVLWFFEAALAAALLSLIAMGLRAVLGPSAPKDLRLALSIGLNSLNYLSLGGCIAAAIFFAGAVSPALVVRKTLVYGATISALLFLFAAVEIFVVERLVELFEVTDHIATAFLGAGFGLAFHPMKHRLEHILHRLAPKQAS